jgi:hypothetical protein
MGRDERQVKLECAGTLLKQSQDCQLLNAKLPPITTHNAQ